VDVSLCIRQRLIELGLDQKDLAAAAQVTESYISQLLARKKAPPAPGRTDIYEKFGKFLGLPPGELASLAEAQRKREFQKRLADPPGPLFRECRELILRKCEPASRAEVQRIFEKEPFGELERLVARKLLDVAQELAREGLESEHLLRSMALLSDRSYEQMRVATLQFLDTDVFHISLEGCVSFLDPMIGSWDIDLKTFSLKMVINPPFAPTSAKRFEFVEVDVQPVAPNQPGFDEFLRDASLSGDATREEIEFLRSLMFNGRRPSALYYYRELQSLRDPLHFPPVNQPGGPTNQSAAT
jgi:transcriptional regulator with XRE-family HTH domain